MKTRSQLSIDDIDFDGASKAWMKNKIKLNDCTYKYKCIKKTIKGFDCKNKPLINLNVCYCHK